jgi:hypothetical protein
LSTLNEFRYYNEEEEEEEVNIHFVKTGMSNEETGDSFIRVTSDCKN